MSPPNKATSSHTLLVGQGRALRVTYDSNAWESIFDTTKANYQSLREAMKAGAIEGFICEAAFRIEAVTKRARGRYFAQPQSDFRLEGMVERDGKLWLKSSFGPDDKKHPGLPPVQAARFQVARDHSVRLLRGLAWMGLPGPAEVCDATAFAPEIESREQRQIDAFAAIDARGVGRAAFLAAGGWNIPTGGPDSEKRFAKACAEWSDGELVCSHIAYQNDILCTNDQGRNAVTSVLNATNRAWLSVSFGIVFMTSDELLALLPR